MTDDILRLKYYETAEEGAGLLDQVRDDWFNDVDIENLDQESLYKCVLYQLYGGYDEGLKAIGINFGHRAFNGGALTDDWILEIEKRRNKSTVDELIPGRRYRVTTTLVYAGNLLTEYQFRRTSGVGDQIFLDKEQTTVEPEPADIRDGDVYRKYGSIYEIIGSHAYETGVSHGIDIADLNLTEEHRIYRKDS